MDQQQNPTPAFQYPPEMLNPNQMLNINLTPERLHSYAMSLAVLVLSLTGMDPKWYTIPGAQHLLSEGCPADDPSYVARHWLGKALTELGDYSGIRKATSIGHEALPRPTLGELACISLSCEALASRLTKHTPCWFTMSEALEFASSRCVDPQDPAAHCRTMLRGAAEALRDFGMLGK